jgi:predicted nucleic acid-binding protein
MARADGWFICRVGFLETARAVGLAAGNATIRNVPAEWLAFAVVELHQQLVDDGTDLALRHELRSLDSLHLAAALTLPREDLTFVGWDPRLRAAARAEGLRLVPDEVV